MRNFRFQENSFLDFLAKKLELLPKDLVLGQKTARLPNKDLKTIDLRQSPGTPRDQAGFDCPALPRRDRPVSVGLWVFPGFGRKGCPGHRRLARHRRGDCPDIFRGRSAGCIQLPAGAPSGPRPWSRSAAANGRCVAIEQELDSPAQGRALVEQAVKAFGRLDTLVVNHGVWPANDAPIAQMAEEQWRNTLAVNLDSVFGLVQAAVAQMENQAAPSRAREAARAHRPDQLHCRASAARPTTPTTP